jgi:serine/threonine protein kinase
MVRRTPLLFAVCCLLLAPAPARARSVSALNHPHICTIYEVGEHEGQAFIVMEHVEGKPLNQLIPSDGLPPESIIRNGTQIGDALALAHERGIVHRDLSHYE